MNHASIVGSAATRDDVYCHLIARRAVVRAALYLGIDCMSLESLDTLAGVLIEYLSRIGATLAATVEASGRSSAHCNALDALRVVELVTIPCCPVTAPTSPTAAAAAAVDDEKQDGRNSHQSKQHNLESYTSWKDLAEFCFGPGWDEAAHKIIEKQQKAMEEKETRRGSTSSNGVRMGSKDLALNLNNLNGGGSNSGVTLSIDGVGVVKPGESGNDTSDSNNGIAGWNAPYPDEVGAFPICPRGERKVANPHTLPEQRFHSNRVTSSSLDTPLPSILSSKHISDHDRIPGLRHTQQQQDIVSSIQHQAVLDHILSERHSLDRIPDDLFTRSDIRDYQYDFFTARTGGDRRKYESIQGSTTNANDVATENNNENSKKKIKLTTGENPNETPSGMHPNTKTGEDAEDDTTSDGDDLRHPIYVPKFYPPFPHPRPSVARTFIDTDEIKNIPLPADGNDTSRDPTDPDQRKPHAKGPLSSGSALLDADATRSVRSALVKLGKVPENQFWGSLQWQINNNSIDNFDGENSTTTNKGTGTNNDPMSINTGSLAVKAGRSGDGTAGAVTSTIVPLNRASGSRVSRILEGSMDSSAM